MKVSKVWDVLQEFKKLCKSRGLRTSETYDWIEADDKYHVFLLTRNIHPSSFKVIASSKKCVVREGQTYRVVEASYMAWLFSDTPPESLFNIFLENPDFSKRVALYDLSFITEGKNMCVKLNRTDSSVFQEFEKFLEKNLGIKVKHYAQLEQSVEDCAPAEAS